MLIGWVISVAVRSVRGVDVPLVPEMGGAALAVKLLYEGLTRRRGPDDESES